MIYFTISTLCEEQDSTCRPASAFSKQRQMYDTNKDSSHLIVIKFPDLGLTTFNLLLQTFNFFFVVLNFIMVVLFQFFHEFMLFLPAMV